jgi:hypothetical protein
VLFTRFSCSFSRETIISLHKPHMFTCIVVDIWKVWSGADDTSIDSGNTTNIAQYSNSVEQQKQRRVCEIRCDRTSYRAHESLYEGLCVVVCFWRLAPPERSPTAHWAKRAFTRLHHRARTSHSLRPYIPDMCIQYAHHHVYDFLALFVTIIDTSPSFIKPFHRPSNPCVFESAATKSAVSECSDTIN